MFAISSPLFAQAPNDKVWKALGYLVGLPNVGAMLLTVNGCSEFQFECILCPKYSMGINEFLTLAGGNLFCILGFVHMLACCSSYLRHIALCDKTKVHYFDLLLCDQL